MTQRVDELRDNYQKLTNNLRDIEEPETLRVKMELIDRMILDTNIAIEDLNFEILQQKVTLSEVDKRDFDDMIIAKETIKTFSPYIAWYNIYQKMLKHSNINT